MGTIVHRETLRAVNYDGPAPAPCQEVLTYQFIPASREFGDIHSIDVHPTETWMLVGQSRGGYVSIWNYETQERITVFKVKDLHEQRGSIFSTKFIAREQWFAAGDSDGWVHVYAYTTEYKVKEFQHHHGDHVNQLAVHPTDPLLLTASNHNSLIKFWDWSQSWTCARVLNTRCTVWRLTVGPRDTNTFATYSNSGHVKIWDLQTMKQVHKLRVTRTSREKVRKVACHPTLPILATVMSRVGSPREIDICLCPNARTYTVSATVRQPTAVAIPAPLCLATRGGGGSPARTRT
ncbi:hypothetical protein C2845_PM17G02230 [Panicum miliaceum]|uniref:Uncharacterized protein n=1 Tax=Panicum miliaceum TaxID=4540 RepID=A0A3L6Q3K5_PANMI|nr:hypothetical protein C2845_PM17G02230 [Panicum miliaceum]